MAPDITNTIVISNKPKTHATTDQNENNLHQRNIQSTNDKLAIEPEGNYSNQSVTNAQTCDKTNATITNELSLRRNKDFYAQIRWPDLAAQTFIHGGAIYGLYLLFQVNIYTIIWFVTLVIGSGFGITAGAHRLWSHKAYTATWQLRLILVFLFTITGQRDAYTWAHDHRVHHKYTETDADPHDARRGFFFAHVGWLFLTPHPEVVAKRKIVDLSDLEADHIVMWQKKFYIPLFALLVIAFPIAVPYYFWNENVWLGFWTVFVCRFCTTLNMAYLVNSVAHIYGNRPFDQNINSRESLPVAIGALGEGWHNYHHVFPWDYKTSELGDYKYNPSTGFIDAFAKLGWAYDLKSVSASMIARRVARTGDGTHILSDANAHKDACWGYGDPDILKEDEEELQRMHG